MTECFRCPVCYGRGMVESGFYSYPLGDTFVSSSDISDKCRSCNGTGIVFYVNEIEGIQVERLSAKSSVQDDIGTEHYGYEG